MNFSDFLIPFLAVGLAELGDKSQILIFLLSSRTKKYWQLLCGVMLGFLIVDGVAILIGSWVVDIVPGFWLKMVTGVIFIVLGILMLISKHSNHEKEPQLRHPFLSGFGMIMMAEWGDKTQIASALFATKYNAYLVFAAVMAALFLLSLSAVYLGKFVAHRINKKTTTTVAGIIFIAVGLLSLSYP